jgi:hypothetical protein
LLRVEAAPLGEWLQSGDLTALIDTLDEWMRVLTPISQVTNAWRPRRRTQREPDWYRPVRRLGAFLGLAPGDRTEEGVHLAIVAAAEWHGNDLGTGSLAKKRDRVRKVLRTAHLVPVPGRRRRTRAD